MVARACKGRRLTPNVQGEDRARVELRHWRAVCQWRPVQLLTSPGPVSDSRFLTRTLPSVPTVYAPSGVIASLTFLLAAPSSVALGYHLHVDAGLAGPDLGHAAKQRVIRPVDRRALDLVMHLRRRALWRGKGECEHTRRAAQMRHGRRRRAGERRDGHRAAFQSERAFQRADIASAPRTPGNKSYRRLGSRWNTRPRSVAPPWSATGWTSSRWCRRWP